MKARVNDRIVVENTQIGGARRVGIVVEVHGRDGAPPYLVEWEDNEHQTLLFPGPDARVQPVAKVG
jgi:hypothetical protein